jgi:FkbM family methyltransferase
MKKTFKAALSHFGWFLRRSEGLPCGVSLGRDWLRIFGRRPAIVFDVGAHRGESAERFLSEFPGCRVFSFEPVSANFVFLARKFAGHPNVRCFHMAFGAKQGRAEIQLGQDSQTHSLSSRPSPKSGKFSCESVLVETLDTFAGEIRLTDRIDLLKIDTEGHEMQVLCGGAGLLADGRVESILAEATLAGEDYTHTSMPTLQKYLASAGFVLAGIYDQESSRQLNYFNALFVRQSQ